MENNKILIALTDDQPLICDGLEKIINSYPDMEVILKLHSGVDLLKHLRQETPKPDILLLDIDMPDMTGIEVLKVVNKEFPEIRVIMLSFHREPYLIVHAFEKGAAAYIQKNESTTEIIKAIKYVSLFGLHMSTEVQRAVSKFLQRKDGVKNQNLISGKPLTTHEITILQMICLEKTNAEIAEFLDITIRTVETHRSTIMKKADATNPIGLVMFAIKNGYFYPSD